MHAAAVKNTFIDFIYRRTRFATLLQVLLVIALGVVAYANTFNATFNFDDVANILGNPVVRSMDPFADPLAVKGSRVVGNLTFAANYRLNGLDVFGYHLVNLAIHLVTALLVYALVLLICKTPYFSADDREGCRRLSGPIALFAALLFVAHPLQTQAVTYIVQRFTSLAAMFYLASMVFYIRARLGQGVPGGRGGAVFYYLLSLAAALLAMKTKEIAFTLPFMIVLAEFMFFKGTLARRLVIVGAFVLTLAVIPLTMLASAGGGQLLGRLLAVTKVQTEMPRIDYLFTQFRVVVTYLRLLFLPVGQNLDHDFPVSHSFWNPEVVLSFLLLSAILGLGVFFVYRSAADTSPPTTDRRPPTAFYRLIAFGIFWFFIALAVESSVIPIVDVIFEHRVYLPSVGFFLALSTAVVLAAEKLAVRRPTLAGVPFLILVVVVCSLAVATFRRNMVWADETTLWEDVAAKSPDKSRPWNNLAYAYLKIGETEAARDQFFQAMQSLGIPESNLIVYGYPVRRLSYHRQEVLEELVPPRGASRGDEAPAAFFESEFIDAALRVKGQSLFFVLLIDVESRDLNVDARPRVNVDGDRYSIGAGIGCDVGGYSCRQIVLFQVEIQFVLAIIASAGSGQFFFFRLSHLLALLGLVEDRNVHRERQAIHVGHQWTLLVHVANAQVRIQFTAREIGSELTLFNQLLLTPGLRVIFHASLSQLLQRIGQSGFAEFLRQRP